MDTLEYKENEYIQLNQEQLDHQIKSDKKSSSFYLDSSQQMELMWDQVNVQTTKPKKKLFQKQQAESKLILKDLKGIVRPGQFTAILGPSGSGKTTLLNFLSGRLISDNLEVKGIVKVNDISLNNISDIGNKIAYVMQDDILYKTLTVKESFMFSANLRLIGKTRSEKEQKVDLVIEQLGLQKCQNTLIGGELIRGISGGERKRTSIGVELLTNPSIIFLDEPTTGLDSETALNVISLLKELAQSGRTVISTIHQPSSQIYQSFDQLSLLVDGNIIYHGNSQDSISYFAQLGFQCPAYTNPSDYFMKCMVQEGLVLEQMLQMRAKNQTSQFREMMTNTKQQFQERIKMLTEKYKQSESYNQIQPKIKNKNLQELTQNLKIEQQSFTKQIYYIYRREITDIFRSPTELKGNMAGMLIMGLITSAIYSDLGTDQAGIQNRRGLCLFSSMMMAFGSIQSNLFMFSQQRPLFLRETINHTFDAVPYFFGKTLCMFPFQILYASTFLTLVFFITGLNNAHWYNFLIYLLIGNLSYFTGASYGMLISTLIPNFNLAISLVPVLMIPFIIMSGFFVNTNNLPVVFKPIEYLSFVKYTYQGLYTNEFKNRSSPYVCSIECDPLGEAGFHETITDDIVYLAIIGVFFRILCMLGLRVISKPKVYMLHPK